MKAMLLAAGRGERMRPLTDHTAKPLLAAGGRALIDYHLFALQGAGVRSVVVNLSWQAAKLRAHLGDGARFGFELRFSEEGPVPLETGGGIHRALPWLGPGAFLVVNADVWTDLPLGSLALPAGSLAHLVLVPNPAHNPVGDFVLERDRIVESAGERLTFSGIGVYRAELFDGCSDGIFKLAPLLRTAARDRRVSGEVHGGAWLDIGTTERLAQLDERLRRRGGRTGRR